MLEHQGDNKTGIRGRSLRYIGWQSLTYLAHALNHPPPHHGSQDYEETVIVITDTHAHGIARYELRGFAGRFNGRFEKARETFLRHGGVQTRKGIRRLFRLIDGHLNDSAWERRCLTDRHGSSGAWLAPEIDGEDMVVSCFSVELHAGRGAQSRRRPRLRIPLHAIARGHQRLGEGDWALLQRELRVAALQSRAVFEVSQAHGLRRFGIPAFHGLLVGDVCDDHLCAKTFVVPPFSGKWGAVLDAWLRFNERAPGAWKEAIEDLALASKMPGLDEALAALGAELTGPRLGFLAGPHTPGRDLEGEMWAAAREQAQSAS